MGDAFWKPNMTPVLPSRLAARMSSTVPIRGDRVGALPEPGVPPGDVVDGLPEALPCRDSGVDGGDAAGAQAVVDGVAVPVADVQPVDDDGVAVGLRCGARGGHRVQIDGAVLWRLPPPIDVLDHVVELVEVLKRSHGRQEPARRGGRTVLPVLIARRCGSGLMCSW